MASRGARECSIQVFGGGDRAPAIEYPACVRQGQNARLEEALRVFDLPVRAAPQELEVTPVGIECEPAPLAAGFRNLLVGVANVLEVELPVLMSLVSQMLRLAGNGVDLTPRGADFLDDSLVPVAP